MISQGNIWSRFRSWQLRLWQCRLSLWDSLLRVHYHRKHLNQRWDLWQIHRDSSSILTKSEHHGVHSSVREPFSVRELFSVPEPFSVRESSSQPFGVEKFSQPILLQNLSTEEAIPHPHHQIQGQTGRKLLEAWHSLAMQQQPWLHVLSSPSSKWLLNPALRRSCPWSLPWCWLSSWQHQGSKSSGFQRQSTRPTHFRLFLW